jgi:hypothetical protein
VALGPLRDMIRTKNRFDRQVAVCHGPNFDFRSLGDPLLQPTAKTMPWPAQIMEVREEISGKSDEGLAGGGERKNVPAVPLARISTRATEAVKNNSG